MKIQLLLFLVAFAGPFCPLTCANPIALPDGDSEAYTTGSVYPTTLEALRSIRGGTTMGPTDEDTYATEVMATKDYDKEIFATSSGAATEHFVTSPPPAAGTTAPAATGALPAMTAPAATGALPATTVLAATTVEAGAEVTAAVETEPKDKVVIEEGTDGASEGLSSNQIAGIVVGSLLAVVIVIAVVIAAVSRMGKYTP